MPDIKIKSPEGRIIEASEKAFEMIYKSLGFIREISEAAAQTKETIELTYDALKGLKKSELCAVAESVGVEVTPDAMTNKQIIEAILGAKE